MQLLAADRTAIPQLSFNQFHHAAALLSWRTLGAQFRQRFLLSGDNIVHSYSSHYNSQYCTKIIAFFLRFRLLLPFSKFLRSILYFLAHILGAQPHFWAVCCRSFHIERVEGKQKNAHREERSRSRVAVFFGFEVSNNAECHFPNRKILSAL